MKGATLRDVWQARTWIEPGAARRVAELRSDKAGGEMRANIALATRALDDPVGYGQLAYQFSLILTQHCRNIMLHLFATLIQGIVAAQHVDIAAGTRSRACGARVRDLNLRSRMKLVGFVEEGQGEMAERFWGEHLAKSGKGVFGACQASMPIDMVTIRTISTEPPERKNLLRGPFHPGLELERTFRELDEPGFTHEVWSE